MRVLDLAVLVHQQIGTVAVQDAGTTARDRRRMQLRQAMTGSLDAILDVTAREPGKSATFKIFTKAIGASSTVTAALQFATTETGGTAVHWTGDLIEVTGLLKMVPKGLLQGTAEKVIEDVWAAVDAKLTAGN